MTKKLKPVHPGEILREEFMVPLGLSMNRVAMDLRVPVTRIADIVNEKRAITADTALRFARISKRAMTWKLPRMRLLIRLNAMCALWKQRQ
jgi:addiction module HigA family antidote